MTPPTIGITLGDAAGIGREIVHAALESGRLDPEFEYRLIGEAPPCLPGQPSPATARAAWDALEEAARQAIAGHVAAVVTGPIHKFKMQEIGFPFPGQTEFFAARCGVEDFAMLLTGGTLTVALVTAHVPLAEVARLLSVEEIVRVGRLLSAFMELRLDRPARIAVAGLNPHAGESGVLGREEIDVIQPAISELNAGTVRAITPPLPVPPPVRGTHTATGGTPALPNPQWIGPVSPDTVFHRAVSGEFDAVLCMYHDQGLIPLKLHAFHEGINVTLGLPFFRTSPDHGTAFEIAGKGIARPDSMIAAINLAAQLARKRGVLRPVAAGVLRPVAALAGEDLSECGGGKTVDAPMPPPPATSRGPRKAATSRSGPAATSRRTPDWPHAPAHRLCERGAYIVTAGTLHKLQLFDTPEKIALLHDCLLKTAAEFGWLLEAWAVFANHYHFVAQSSEDASSLTMLIRKLHAVTARELNRLDRTPGRKVWHNFWDTHLTFERSYFARLNYVHQNAVKHGMVPVANQYPWCSAAWFERTALPSTVKTIYSFEIDLLTDRDDFGVLGVL